ncbi:MAG: hypothetical protein IPI56_06970 [Elusimicrobia bacterium]|nr:hypothetical protein [Elusimicrobiota bacterium]
MRNCIYGYKELLEIKDLIDGLKEKLILTNWLFVCIDSNRDEKLFRAVESCGILKNARYGCKIGNGGLWIPGENLMAMNKETNTIVPFSAAYLFSTPIKKDANPSYNLTSESKLFSENVPEKLTEIYNNGALGYVSDGCGLNYYFKENRLFSFSMLNAILDAGGDVDR